MSPFVKQKIIAGYLSVLQTILTSNWSFSLSATGTASATAPGTATVPLTRSGPVRRYEYLHLRIDSLGILKSTFDLEDDDVSVRIFGDIGFN